MVRDAFEERRKGLEEGFFARLNNQLIDKIKAERLAVENREALVKVTGINDPKVIDALADLNLTASTIMALSLIPLIQVAWADKHLDVEERAAVLEAAQSLGIGTTHPAAAVLEAWLDQCPNNQLFTVWLDYIKALREELRVEAAEALQEEIIARSISIAEASGGLMGLKRISPAEDHVLQQIKNAFH